MAPELHYYPATDKCPEPHIEKWGKAAVDLTGLTKMGKGELGPVFGTDYEEKNIEKAVKVLGISPAEVRAKLEAGEVVKW